MTYPMVPLLAVDMLSLDLVMTYPVVPLLAVEMLSLDLVNDRFARCRRQLGPLGSLTARSLSCDDSLSSATSRESRDPIV